MEYKLNQGQQDTADKLFEFLLNDERELIINGPGGVGKTHLLGYLVDRIIPQYQKMCQMMGIPQEYHEVHMTATTNKAAEVLAQAISRETKTIYAFLGLKVRDDYSTGKSVITKTNAWSVKHNQIIVIDEDSMIDHTLLTAIREGTNHCKVIFVGDDCQLAPVGERISPIFTENLPMCELTEPMRNAGQPALKAVCAQLREGVKQNDFAPIQIVPGVIDHYSPEQMEAEITQVFAKNNPKAKILAYSNPRVMMYNNFIREVRKLPQRYITGEVLVNNSAIAVGRVRLAIEQEVEIIQQDEKTEFVDIMGETALEVRTCTLRAGLTTFCMDIPEDREHFLALIKHYQKMKNWQVYFKLKNTYPDLRPNDACTVYKAQGSTYDTVYIDVGNISSCNQAPIVTRLLNVAFSRARNRVVLYGDLAQKYGGILT